MMTFFNSASTLKLCKKYVRYGIGLIGRTGQMIVS
jgi:hypothetical protein